MSSFVVSGCYGLESLMAGSVPNLELDGFLVHFKLSNLEIDSDSRHEVIGVCVFLKVC